MGNIICCTALSFLVKGIQHINEITLYYLFMLLIMQKLCQNLMSVCFVKEMGSSKSTITDTSTFFILGILCHA